MKKLSKEYKGYLKIIILLGLLLLMIGFTILCKSNIDHLKSFIDSKSFIKGTDESQLTIYRLLFTSGIFISIWLSFQVILNFSEIIIIPLIYKEKNSIERDKK